MVAYPLTGIGEIHRERGNLAQARAAFEEAIAVSEESGDVQGMAPALAGLATVIAAEEPERARDLAERAIHCDPGLGYVISLLAAGWVAAVTGDSARAAEHAITAAAAAQARRDRAGLAEALSLIALSAPDPHREAQRLREAVAIWQEIGDPLGDAKARLAVAHLESGGSSVADRRRAEQRLEVLGVRPQPLGKVAAGILATLGHQDAAMVRIESLGGFSVTRGGQVVTVSQWQSRRARDLLKVLIARRGRPASRSALMECLWPYEDPDRLGNRLSVALSTVRSVLDPERQFASDAFIRAGKDTVAVNLDAVDVDLERFLAAAADGLGRLSRGDVDAAVPILGAAEIAYAGDFLEENAYGDWAVAPPEEARAAYVAVTRALAQQALAGSSPEAAVPYFLRILQVDR